MRGAAKERLLIRRFGLTHSRARIAAARAFIAFVAAIAMLSAGARSAKRTYVCVAMAEMRDAPYCPRAHDSDASESAAKDARTEAVE